MDLTIDLSFLYQVVLFLLLWVVLQRVAFEPTFTVLDAREARTTGTRKEAERLRQEAERHREHFEQSVHETRALLARESEAAARAAAAEHARVVGEARTAATEQVEEARRAAARELETAREALAAEVDSIAERMLARALGQERR